MVRKACSIVLVFLLPVASCGPDALSPVAPTREIVLPPTPALQGRPQAAPDLRVEEIGVSVLDRPILVYRFGSGPVHVAVVGGIHGGFEGNTVHLVEELVRHFRRFPEDLPDEITLHIVPCLNPDGYALGKTPSSRLNANGVDLNRNWDDHWQPEAQWKEETVSGGSAPFSEPETRALRGYVLEYGITAVILYHSKGGFVSSSREGTGSEQLARCFSAGSRYLCCAGDLCPFGYDITGDAASYLDSRGVAAIDIELPTHTDIDLDRNLSGLLSSLRCLQDNLRQETNPTVAPP